MFESDRVDRSQALLRYFEEAGIIRFEQKGTWITAIPTAVAPDGIILEQNMKEIALTLLRAAQTSLQQPGSLVDDDTVSRVKQA